MLKLSEKELKERAIADLRWLMNDERGRRVMRRILVMAGLYDSPFRQPEVEGVSEAERLVHNCALLRFGQRIAGAVGRASPEGYDLMETEDRFVKALERESEKDGKRSE